MGMGGRDAVLDCFALVSRPDNNAERTESTRERRSVHYCVILASEFGHGVFMSHRLTAFFFYFFSVGGELEEKLASVRRCGSGYAAFCVSSILWRESSGCIGSGGFFHLKVLIKVLVFVGL